MFRSRVAPTLLLAAGLTLGACGGGSDADDPAADASTPATASGEAEPSSTEAAPSETPAAADTTADDDGSAPADVSGGSCRVTITGDVEKEWTSSGGYSAVGYGPWVPPQPGVTMPIPMDETFFILNCAGEGDDYVGFAPRAEQGIPMEPATYVIAAADNAFGASETGIMTMLIGLDGTDTNWGPAEDGELVITEFDERHIAGTFTVTVTDVLADLGGTPSKGTAVITGEFDYDNPNL